MSPRPSPKKAKPSADRQKPPASGDRLQKVLAAAGVASRRECEELIREGRVEVDHKVVTELGSRVDAATVEIRVDGEVLRRQRQLHFAVNKPVGVVCTSRDPSGRMRVIDLIPTEERLFTVGRLDRNSEGLILVTNDGELANRLAHPRYGVEKIYQVRVAGHPTPEDLQTLRRGVHLAEGAVKVVSAKIKRRHKQATDLEIVLNEGRNREIRRLLAQLGHKVLFLKRTAIGPLRLGKLPVGASRRLTNTELQQLKRCTDPSSSAKRGKSRTRRPSKGSPRS